MTTITINLSGKQVKQFNKVHLNKVVAHFLEDYLKSTRNEESKKSIKKSNESTEIIHKLAESAFRFWDNKEDDVYQNFYAKK